MSHLTDLAGRIPVQPDLSIPHYRNIFVIGDMASLKDTSGKLVPGLASAAMQEGKATAKNILRDLQGKERTPFKYLDKGSMATIGEIGQWSSLVNLSFPAILHDYCGTLFTLRCSKEREIVIWFCGNGFGHDTRGNAVRD